MPQTSTDNTALLTMTTDRDRYREGLDRCVAELNRVANGSGARVALAPMPPPAASAPVAEAHISALYSGATVTPLGDQMLVTGKLYNTGDAAGRATAVVSLLRDGKVTDTARVPVSVPAQGQASWSYKFRWHGQEGSWTATVNVEP